MVKSTTKYSVIVKDAKDIKYHLEKAYYLSQGKARTNLDRCSNRYSKLKINPKMLRGFKIISKNLNFKNLDNKIKKVAELLAKSKKPILHLGQGVKISKGQKYLRKITIDTKFLLH